MLIKNNIDSKLITTSKKRSFMGVEYITSGNYTVDMIQCIILNARLHRKPIKTILLSGSRFDNLDTYMRFKLQEVGKKDYANAPEKPFGDDRTESLKDVLEELCDETKEVRRYMFDGVNIEEARYLVSQEYKLEYHPRFLSEESRIENRIGPDFSGLENKMNDLPDPSLKITFDKPNK